MELYFSKQRDANKLRKELESHIVLNANVLDYLLAHPRLISEVWKVGGKCFLGTIYSDDAGRLFARALYWNGSRWYWYHIWLDRGYIPHTSSVVVQAS